MVVADRSGGVQAAVAPGEALAVLPRFGRPAAVVDRHRDLLVLKGGV